MGVRRIEKEAQAECNKKVKGLIKEAKKAEKLLRKQIMSERHSLRQKAPKNSGKEGINNWLTLDNAGVIYPSIREENWDFVYRVSALLKSPIESSVLQKAVEDLTPRFPSFFVKLKTGFFWSYFEDDGKTLKVEKEEDFPCQRFKKGSNEHLIRVLYYNNRISVECFHALADGRSTLKFLNSLIKHYLELLGERIDSEVGCLNVLDKPKPEEMADSFSEYVDDSKKLKHKELRAYRIEGTQEDFGVINSTLATMSVKQLKEVAKRYNCKMFEFLIAVLGFSIWKRVPKTQKRNRPIKISVPIDLRQFFPSESLRNFSGYLNVEIPIKKEYAIEEVIEIVKQEMSKIDKNLMQGFINSNVAIKSNFFIKIIPLFIKNFFINMFFKLWGESYQTLAVSNLGLNSVPSEFSNRVERFEFNVGRPKYNAKSMGIVSFNDKLVCILSSKIKENTTEKDFFTTLSGLGVELVVESNRRDLYE